LGDGTEPGFGHLGAADGVGDGGGWPVSASGGECADEPGGGRTFLHGGGFCATPPE